MIPIQKSLQSHNPHRTAYMSAGDDDDDDLWFLPGPPELEDVERSPLPRAPTRALGLVEDWGAAEAAQARDLARAAGRLGELSARLRQAPSGVQHRLALIDASEMGWVSGDRVALDRLALWIALRIGHAGDEVRSLERASWAVRRLAEGPGPAEAGAEGLADFLGRLAVEPRLAQSGLESDGWDEEGRETLIDRAENWRAVQAEVRPLHAITRAAVSYWTWHLVGFARRAGSELEAAVVAARIAAEETPGLRFAPLGLGGAGGLRASGDIRARLGAFYVGVETAAISAIRDLDALASWRERALADVAGLSGRTPPLLVAAFAAWPMLSAPMAERLTGASRPGVLRNIRWMADRGLLREITGQERYRFWKAGF